MMCTVHRDMINMNRHTALTKNELTPLKITSLQQKRVYSGQKKKVNDPEGAKYFFPV